METSAQRNGGTAGKSAERMMSALLTIHSATTLDELADASCSAARYVLDAAHTFVYIDDGEGALDWRTPATEVRRRSLRKVIDACGKDALPARIDAQRMPAMAEALEGAVPTLMSAEAFFHGVVSDAVRGEPRQRLGIAMVALAPLVWNEERAGALLLMFASTPDVEAIRSFAEHVACAAASLREAAESGVIDVVRSVFDTRKLESDLQKELARAVRYKREVSIAVIEATNLRLLRERFGRSLTGRLFDALGAVLAVNSRDIDSIGVYKESGYTMILTEAAAEGARTAAERLLATANDVELSGELVPGLELHLACGWATCPEDGVTSEAIFGAAERRMYQAEEQVA